MGIYFRPGNLAFAESLNSEIYVDKSMVISYTNRVMETEQKYICVSRPRRFGKSMTANMLAAYYDKSCDSHKLFADLKIAGHPSYHKNINQSSVLHLDIAWFRTVAQDAGQTIKVLQSEVLKELREAYPQVVSEGITSLPLALATINSITGEKFVIIIDEWDCLFREDQLDKSIQEDYIEFLRSLFKSAPSSRFIQLAYMTGILPIKKYGTQSALNNFKEFTMINPGIMAEYTGFTETEVKQLCQHYSMDFEETKHWYDGYHFNKAQSIYSPKSVVEAMLCEEFDNYWTGTDTYQALKLYIDMNFDGLKSAIALMLGGARCKINPQKFQNDMTSVNSKDDVMTLLVHLGYLAYDSSASEVYIPNQEVADEFENAIEDGDWKEIAAALNSSEQLLNATIHQDAKRVAEMIEYAHSANASILGYNQELSLSCVITIAYYSARKDYTLIRELPSGKGFADMAFIPRRNSDKPALLVEIKWNQSAETAINQIKNNNYSGALEEYKNNLILVGINYDKKTKKHSCIIEKY